MHNPPRPPPPPPPPPPELEPEPKTEPTQSKLVRCIAIVLVGLVVLVGIIVFNPWIVINRKRLAYSIENGTMHDFSLTNNNHLNASFNFVLRSYNPIKVVSIYYNKMDAKVYFEGKAVANDAVEPFFQPRRNVTMLEVKLVAQDVSLSGSVARDLRLEKSSGQVELKVRFKARIRFKVGVWKSRHQSLRIDCTPVLVHDSSNNFKRTSCHVDDL